MTGAKIAVPIGLYSPDYYQGCPVLVQTFTSQSGQYTVTPAPLISSGLRFGYSVDAVYSLEVPGAYELAVSLSVDTTSGGWSNAVYTRNGNGTTIDTTAWSAPGRSGAQNWTVVSSSSQLSAFQIRTWYDFPDSDLGTYFAANI